MTTQQSAVISAYY